MTEVNPLADSSLTVALPMRCRSRVEDGRWNAAGASRAGKYGWKRTAVPGREGVPSPDALYVRIVEPYRGQVPAVVSGKHRKEGPTPRRDRMPNKRMP